MCQCLEICSQRVVSCMIKHNIPSFSTCYCMRAYFFSFFHFHFHSYDVLKKKKGKEVDSHCQLHARNYVYSIQIIALNEIHRFGQTIKYHVNVVNVWMEFGWFLFNIVYFVYHSISKCSLLYWSIFDAGIFYAFDGFDTRWKSIYSIWPVSWPYV